MHGCEAPPERPTPAAAAVLTPFGEWVRSPEAPAMLRWSTLQRGLWVNGVDSIDDAIDMVRYGLSPVAMNIVCPTFLSQAMDDPVADDAPDLCNRPCPRYDSSP
jgi:hypothetical protein